MITYMAVEVRMWTLDRFVEIKFLAYSGLINKSSTIHVPSFEARITSTTEIQNIQQGTPFVSPSQLYEC